MNANHLLYYLRGVFELVDEPTSAQIRALRNEVLRATPVAAELIPVEVVDPSRRLAPARTDCGCSGTASPPASAPAPYIDPTKLPR